MRQELFTLDKYGRKRHFWRGQSVRCVYYHEYPPREDPLDAYKRTWLSRLIDVPFCPVKTGIIIKSCGVHPFWLGDDREEEYLLIRFSEYRLDKPIPISCIQSVSDDEFYERERLIREISDSVVKRIMGET